MYDSEFAAYLGIFIIMAVVVLFIGFVISILNIVVNWRIFEKANIPGWAALIPVYNYYCFFKLAWNPIYFWIACPINIAISALYVMQKYDLLMDLRFYLLFWVLCFLNMILRGFLKYNIAKSFGQGFPFFIGLFLFEFVFKIVLAFADDKYIGNAIMRRNIDGAIGYYDSQNQNYGNVNKKADDYKNFDFASNNFQRPTEDREDTYTES